MTKNEPKKIWDNKQHIKDIMKSDAKKVVIDLVAKDGVKYISLRSWYKKKTSNDWMPSTEGITVPIELPIQGNAATPMLDVICAVQAAMVIAKDFALENDENAVWIQPK